MDILQITQHIQSFQVSYKDIFVQTYILQTQEGTVLFDAAAGAEDVDNYILPALEQLGVSPTHIFISHNHRDHSGGLARAVQLFPSARIIARSPAIQETYPNAYIPEDGEVILDCLQVVTIPGHTSDSAALLDLRTNTLVTGDCLQSFGIYGSGEWYGAISMPAEHAIAIQKLRALPIDNIATGHDYHPDGLFSFGKEHVAQRLNNCIDALRRLQNTMAAHPQMNDEQIAQLCNDGTFPTVSHRIVAAVRRATLDGAF